MFLIPGKIAQEFDRNNRSCQYCTLKSCRPRASLSVNVIAISPLLSPAAQLHATCAILLLNIHWTGNFPCKCHGFRLPQSSAPALPRHPVCHSCLKPSSATLPSTHQFTALFISFTSPLPLCSCSCTPSYHNFLNIVIAPSFLLVFLSSLSQIPSQTSAFLPLQRPSSTASHRRSSSSFPLPFQLSLPSPDFTPLNGCPLFDVGRK